MIFSSTVFTFIFLPMVILIYGIVKDNYKNIILLVASLLFYSYGEPKNVVIMLISIICNWGMALLISNYREKGKKRIATFILVCAVAGNLSILFIFKYFDFSVTVANKLLGTHMRIWGLALPIGISFYTFQAISYIVDVYRGAGKVQANVLNVGLYISFFPQLIAGPIVRYSSFMMQLSEREITIELFAQGIKRFILGFMKKILLANNIALVAEEVFEVADISELSVGVAWIGAIAYTLQIYYDFSGYSDMAIGLGKMFGFRFQENFNYPYMASSITDFWKRWHISLSQWFRDYVYIPLGGSRVTVGRHIVNMFIVWTLTGLWHGANYTFILWGMIYFVFLTIEKYIIKPEKRRKVVKSMWRVVTLCIVIIAWVFFRADTLSMGVEYCRAMFGQLNIPLWSSKCYFTIKNNVVFIIVGIIFSTPIVSKVKNRIGCKNAVEETINIIYIAGFLWAVSYLVLGAHNPFIYYNF